MVGSTTPFAEQADWHPVHRANAMLRAALLSSARQTEPADDLPNVESLSRAVESVLQERVQITFPQPLAARLDALDIEEDAFPAFETLVGKAFQAESQDAQEEVSEAWETAEAMGGEADDLEKHAPIDPGFRVLPPQMHMQSLLHEFHRRQRQASVLVAGCITMAVLLTVGGLWLVANYATPRPSDSALRSTSVAWQPATSGATSGLPPVSVSANREAKAAPLLVPAHAAFPKPSSPPAQIILAEAGRRIAFAPLLPPNHAGYFLIRGLPVGATLTAGQRSVQGSWIVKSEQAHALALAVGDVAAGDYPIEVYILRSGDSPQARRNLVLRIATSLITHAAAPENGGWASGLLGLVPAARAAEAPSVPSQPAALRDRANRLLAEGDIAGARLLLLYLAERGEGEAAYDLARTFDEEMLNQEFGARGMQGDLAQARDWYARAAQSGNARATERLKVLASLSGTRPSD